MERTSALSWIRPGYLKNTVTKHLNTYTQPKRMKPKKEEKLYWLIDTARSAIAIKYDNNSIKMIKDNSNELYSL